MGTEIVESWYDADTLNVEGRDVSSRSNASGAPELTNKTFEDGEEVKTPNQAGVIARNKMQAIAPAGSELELDFQGFGPFGRMVETQRLKKNGQSLDLALIQFDQRAARYESQYRQEGRSDDAVNALFESGEVPFKIGATSAALDEESYNALSKLRNEVNTMVMEVQQNPSPENQEKLDELSAQLYGDNADNLRAWHFMNHPSSALNEAGEYEMQAGHWMDDYQQVIRYNQRAMGNRGKAFQLKPSEGVEVEEDSSVIAAMYRKYSSIHNLGRMIEMSNANTDVGIDYDVPTDELLKDVLPENHHYVLSQPTSAGARQAREHIIDLQKQDVAITDATWYESLLGGAIAFAGDPTTYLAGGLAVKGMGVTAGLGRTAYIASKGAPAYRTFAATSKAKNIAAINTWATGGAVGSSVALMPNLVGDPRATFRTYMADVLVDTAMGAGFGGLAIGNRALSGTKLGTAIGLANQEIIQRSIKARDAYFSRIAQQQGVAMSALDSTPKTKAQKVKRDREEFWSRLGVKNDEIEKEALAAAAERLSIKATDPSLQPYHSSQTLADIANQAVGEAEDETINAVLKEMKEAGFDDLVPDNVRELFTPEVLERIPQEQRKSIGRKLDIDMEDVISPEERAFKDYVESGEQALDMELMKSPTVTGMIGKTIGRVAMDMATHLRKSDNTGLNYLGSKVTELGAGLGGNASRAPTGGLYKAREADMLNTHFFSGYESALSQYITTKGHGQWIKFKAMQDGADYNPAVREFSRDLHLYMNSLRMGQKEFVPHPAIKQFVDEHFSKYTQRAHDSLTKAGVEGFHKGNKLDNYIWHTYNPVEVEKLVSQHGEETLIKAMMKGIRNANANNPDVPKDRKGLRELATGRLDAIRGLTDDVDQYMPGLESTAKKRVEMDMAASDGEFTLVDLLDMDVAKGAERYTQRVSGLVGFARATNGLINGNKAWDRYKQATLARSTKANQAKDAQFLEDVYDMMMGRPTRGGLPSWLRSLRDMAVMTQMGNLGLNEVMEAGLSANKAVMTLMRDPKAAKMAYNASRGGKQTKDLMEDVVSISGLTDFMHFMERHASHLDVANTPDGKLGRALDTAAHNMTGGNLMAQGKALLAKTTGFNMARRAKYRGAQMSMVVDIAKRLNKGNTRKALTNDARFKDLGLLDNNGNSPLTKMFNDPNKVEYDANGNIKRIFGDALTEVEKDHLGLVLYRAASQDVQKHIVGELPPYLNNPYFNVMLQYLSFPLVATNKQLARNSQFADIEALSGVMLNLIVTGTVQHAMVELGMRKEEEVELNTFKYYSSLGILPDIGLMGMEAMEGETPSLDRIPTWSVMGNYAHLGKESAKYAMSLGEDQMGVNDIKPVVYMQNHATLKIMANMWQEHVAERIAKEDK